MELVSLEALSLVLVLFSNYCHITNMAKAITAIRNMAFQHREFRTRLRDAERLRLYAQSAFFDKKALSALLMEAESKSRRLELEAREAVERETHAEAERYVSRREVAMARLEIDAVSSPSTDGI